MSFGGPRGVARPGGKGNASRKERKVRRRKQGFHSHRQRTEEATMVAPQELRSRFLLSLERLGSQTLSENPGGYDLQSWLRSFNALLDDCEEKFGDLLPLDFESTRETALARVRASLDTSSIDAEIERCRAQEADLEARIRAEARDAADRLSALKEERDKVIAELAAERRRLLEMQEEADSRPFFSRILGRGVRMQSVESKATELESAVARLEAEIGEATAARSRRQSGSGGHGGATDAGYVELTGVRERLDRLVAERRERTQLLEERQAATAAMAAVLQSIDMPPAET